MRFLLFLAFALSGCVTMSPKAQIRAQAGVRLERCLRGASYWMPFQIACYRENEAYCLDQGLERDCGTDWVFINRTSQFR